MLQLLPYALAAYGGLQGYRQSKDQGIGGLNRLLNTAAGAFTGYNLGQNLGRSAGQSIFWPHIHFLPRHKGDVKGRNAGIRNAVAEIDPYNPENK